MGASTLLVKGGVMEWILVYEQRPWTVNAERNWHYHKRAKLVKQWREGFCELAGEEGIPELERMYIEACPVVRDRRLQDTCAANNAVKAAIDGIVDAGVVPDDSKEWLGWVKQYPCETVKGQDALIVKVIGEPVHLY